MRKSLTLSAFALITAGLAAQSTTIPTGYDTTEGSSGAHALLRYTPARQQSFYLPKATGWKGPKVIKSLWMRADSSWSKGPAFKCDIMVEVSSKGIATDPTKTNTDWNKNHGTDKKVFMKKKAYNIPAFTAPKTPPHKWMIELKGDAPFVDVNKQLCVDTRVYTPKTQSNAFWYVDAAPSSSAGFYNRFGTSCNPNIFYNYATGYNVTQTFRTYGYSRNKGDIVLSWLGSKKLNLSVGGGCTLYTNVVLFHPTPVKTTSTSGYANFTWGTVPASAAGAVVYNQMVAITPALSLRWSRGTEIHIGTSPTVYYGFGVYNYASGSRTFNPDTSPAQWWSSSVIIHDVK
jgi:hypothetical protein